MGDWEDLCDHYGMPNSGDSDWLIDMINQGLDADRSKEDFDDDAADKKPILKHKNGLIVDDSNWEYSAEKNKNEFFEKLVFDTLDEVKNYAMTYPDTCFAKNPNGHGYVIKKVTNTSHNIPKHIENIRKGKPPRSHFPWEDSEIAQLTNAFNSGKKIHEIAIEHERSLISILAKLNNIGLIKTEEFENMINNPDLQPSCNKLFDFFMNNSYVAVNLLSRFYQFDKFFINKYDTILNFQELSSSEYVKWDNSLFEKYGDRWNWYKLSNNKSLPWSEDLIRKYENFWTWGHSKKRKESAYDGMGGYFIHTDYYYGLSNNESIPWTDSIIERYKDKWSFGTNLYDIFLFTAKWWSEKKLVFSNNESLPWSETIIEKFIDKWNWNYMSYSKTIPWSEKLIVKFDNKWDWFSLSANESISWSEALIQKYDAKLNWNHLSKHGFLPWSEAFIEKYKDKLKWNDLSDNRSLPWSEAILEKYKYKWSWDKLGANESIPWTEALIEKYKNDFKFFTGISSNESLPWSESLIERYKDEWDWGDEYYGGLSSNESLPWTEELIEKYIDKWNFGEDGQGGLSSNEALPWSETFFEKYIDKWIFHAEDSWDDFSMHGGINKNRSLPWSATFVEKHKDKWVWDYLVENEGLPWDEALIELFISCHCYPSQNNTKVHKLIKKLTPSQVQVILENHKIS
jgi:hypothetical protein